MKSRYRRSPDTFFAEVNGSYFLLNILSAEYFILSQDTARLWRILDKPYTTSQIISRLQAEYGYSRTQHNYYLLVKVLDSLVNLHLLSTDYPV